MCASSGSRQNAVSSGEKLRSIAIAPREVARSIGKLGNIAPTDELALDFWTDLSLRESRAPGDRGPWFFAKSRVGILVAASSINPGYQTGRLPSVSGVLRKA